MTDSDNFAEDILKKELNDVRRQMRELKKSSERVTVGMQAQFRMWEKHIAQSARMIQVNKERIAGSLLIKNTQHKNRMAEEKFHSDNVERHKRWSKTARDFDNQMKFVTQSLTKGLTVRGAMAKAGEQLIDLGKKHREQQLVLMKNMSETDPEKRDKNLQSVGIDPKTGEGEVKKGATGKMGRVMDKLGEFGKKHAGGMMLAAGAGGLILGVIIKALSVAPMFQQMMKLFKFTVSLILMPIGTFFGAILRPLLISMIRGIAPNFKAWMKTSMSLGDKVGKGILAMFATPEVFFGDALGGVLERVGQQLIKDSLIATAFGMNDSPEEKAAKQEEHDKYWKGVGKQMDAIWKEFMRPILTFVGYLNSFFYVVLPDAFAGLTSILSGGLEYIGTELLKPLWNFIGTLNTLFFVELPEFVGGIGKRFGEFWEGVFESVRNFVYSIPVIGEMIEGYFEKSKDNLKDAPKDAKHTAKAMEGITKTFDNAWKWISNALRRVSAQTYTTASGSRRPTAAARNAKRTLRDIAGGGIDSSGSSTEYGSAAYHYSFLNPVKMAKGGIITEPIMGIGKSGQSYLMGESGNEMVTPMNQVRNGNVNININIGKVERNADFNQLKPMIQRWILEANSRRGMI